jgi:hypothetical protein
MQIFSHFLGSVKSVITTPIKQILHKDVAVTSLPDVVSVGSIKQVSDEMITTIAEKMRNNVVTPESLNALMAQFDKKDHPYVFEILQKCSLALNPTDIMNTIQTLQPTIEKAFNTSQVEWLSLDTAKAGLSLMYHLRKKGRGISKDNCLGPSLYGKEAPKDMVPQAACIMDTVFSRVLTTEEVSLLASIPQLATANIGHFEAGISYIDWATGKATNKIKALVTKVKAQQKALNTKDISTATNHALNEQFAENINRINQARSILGHSPVRSYTLDSSLSRESIEPKNAQKALLNYCQNSNPSPQKIAAIIEMLPSTPDEKILLTKLLSSPNGLEFFNVNKTMASLQQIEKNLLNKLKQDNLQVENVLIVTDLETAKSSALITYLFREQTATFKPEQFISKDELLDLKEHGKLSTDKAILFLDDINGTGSTVSAHIHSNSEAFSTVGKVYVGHLTGYRSAEENLPQMLQKHLDRSEITAKVDPINVDYVKPTSTKISLTNPQHPIMSELTPIQQVLLQTYENNFEGDVANQAYFWSFPDNLEGNLGDFINQAIDIPFRR